jgi:hypothetical protein
MVRWNAYFKNGSKIAQNSRLLCFQKMYCFRENSNFPLSNKIIITLPISLLWYWKCLKNSHLLDLYIKTIIFLLYNYIHVFNSSQNDWTFWYKSVISSVEVYDKHIITCHFLYHTLYQPSFIYHPLSLTALGLISWPRADKGHDMKNAM